MKKAYLGTICLVLAIFASFSACADSAVSITEPSGKGIPVQAEKAEASCLRFVEQELIGDAGVYTNYLSREASNELSSGHEVLSESQGLMLCYYAAVSNHAQYEKMLSFIQNKLDSGVIISYRLREDGSRFPVNASVDDMRILRGMLEGAQVFSEPEYKVICDKYAKRLYNTNVEDNILLDFYDETYASAGRLCTLCYSDLKTMLMLGERDKRWLKVEKRMRKIVLDGYLGDDFPLFSSRYLPDTGDYFSEKILTVEALLTALHLSEVGECPEATVNWLKKTLSDGAVYGEYTEKGKPATHIESTAVYALCALLGVYENEPELVQSAIDKLCAFQITDDKSAIYGAFGNAVTLQTFSFDNLMALTALREQTEYFAVKEAGGAD